MLTVMTESKDIPMLFFVYDDVTSKNEKAIKKFLLHTINEPKIDGNTVTVTQEGGKLVLTSLLGADRIEGIGGKGKGFWAGEDGTNGYNIADQVEDGWEDSLWGRVEINATGRATDKMLNVIYVTDKDGGRDITPMLIDTDKLAGAYADGVAALFAKSRDGEDGEIEFTLPSDAEVYVTGLSDGKWNVTGGFVGEVQTESTSDGTPSGLIRFTASAGRVSLKKI
jgi:heparin/heparan-sulfate lyase